MLQQVDLEIMSNSTLQRRWPFFTQTRDTRLELLDDTDLDSDELNDNLRDIRRVNRYFGGVSATLIPFASLANRVETDQVTVLDLGTGSADIPVAISSWAISNQRAVRIIASDVSSTILAQAAQQLGANPSISLAQLDARQVPFADKSIDIVLCSLALHHFDPPEAVKVLSEMNRVARVGWILNDLVRSQIGFAITWFASRLTTRNRLTQHDAPLSIKRAYTPAELEEFLQNQSISGVDIDRSPWFRMVAVKDFGYGHE
jgi:ubiquinone/menaquinone biosynthesis C-methylase UbiE